MIPNIFGNKPSTDPLEEQYKRSLQTEAGVEHGIQKENQKDIVAKQVEMFKQMEEAASRKSQLEGKVLFEEMAKDLNPFEFQNMNKVRGVIGLPPIPEKVKGRPIAEYAFMATKPGQRFFMDEIQKELHQDSKEFIKSIPGFAKSLLSLTPISGGERVASEILGSSLSGPKSVMEPKGYVPKGKRVKKITGYIQSQLEGAKSVAGLIAWLPDAMSEMVRNPAKFVMEKPVDTMFLMAAGSHMAKGKAPSTSIREATRADMPYRTLGETKPLMQRIERPQAEMLSLEHQIRGQADKALSPEVTSPEIGTSKPSEGMIPATKTTSRPSAEMVADSTQIPEAMEYKYSGFDPIEYFKHGRHMIGEHLKSAVGTAPVHKISNGKTEVFANEVAPFIDGSIKDLDFGRFKHQRMWNKNTTPAIYVFDKVPTLKKALYRPWQVGEKAAYDSTMHTRQTVVPRWNKMLLDEGSPIKNSKERIAGMLIEGQKNGPEILNHMGRKDLLGLKPTPAEAKIMSEARAWYDFYFESINKSRELAGMKPMKYNKDYFTFMRDLADLKEMGRGYEELSSLIPEDISLRGVPFRYQKARKFGAIGGVKLDFFDVYSKYAEKAHKAIEITPVVGKGRAMLERMTFDAGQLNPKTGKPVKSRWQMKYTHPEAAEWTSAWLNRIAEAPTPSAPFFKPIERVFSVLNKNASFAILSGNVRSALIQPTALRLAYVELGEKYFLDGFGRVWNKGQRDFAIKNSLVLAPRSFDIHAQSVIEGKGAISRLGKLKQSAGELGIKPLQQLDQWTAEAAWLGAYEKATKAMKLEHTEAIQWADDLVTKTQASAKTGDISPIQAHPMGKVASMFQTFVINEWHQTLKNVVGIGGEKMSGVQRAKNVGRLAFSTAVINAVFEGGLNIRSPLPSPEWALKEALENDTKWNDALLNILKELAEPIPIFGGSIRYSTPYRQAGPPALQIMDDAKNAVDSFISKGELGIAQFDAVGKLLGIPGTSQISKFLRRMKKGHTIPESILGVKSDQNVNLKKKADPYDIYK